VKRFFADLRRGIRIPSQSGISVDAAPLPDQHNLHPLPRNTLSTICQKPRHISRDGLAPITVLPSQSAARMTA
jgi:hypothetical protein